MVETKLNNAGASTSIEEIHGDILIQVLHHLDGLSLASVNSTTSYLHSISSHPDLWRRLCLSTWPSLNHPLILPLVNSAPHRFFSDVFSFPTSFTPTNYLHIPNKLFYAVDLYKHDIPIYSFVLEYDCFPNHFYNTIPLRMFGPDIKTNVLPEELTLSWIVIDPTKGRAVNLSSRKAMVVSRHCWGWKAVARFTLARDGWVVGVLGKWRDELGMGVVKLHLTVWDEDDVPVRYLEGLRVVMAAIEAERKPMGEEDTKEGYSVYDDMKINKEELRQNREWTGI